MEPKLMLEVVTLIAVVSGAFWAIIRFIFEPRIEKIVRKIMEPEIGRIAKLETDARAASTQHKMDALAMTTLKAEVRIGFADVNAGMNAIAKDIRATRESMSYIEGKINGSQR